MEIMKMILTINLRDDEVEDFDLYKGVEYLWLNINNSVTQYDDMETFRNNWKEHVGDMDGDNWVGVIDTDKKGYHVVNINANVRFTGLEEEA
jgi:hypothetical protein